MNKSTSQPHLSRQDLDELENSEWLCRPPESQQIRQFKVIVRDLPRVQRHNWQKHKWPNKGVQSLSNLECIVENSLESDQETENSPADSQDNLDSVRSEQPNRTDQFYKPIGKPIESADRALDSRGSEVLDSRTSNSRASDRADSRMLDSRASDRLADDPRILRTNEPTEVVHSIATISRLSSQLYQTDRQTSDWNVLNSNETNRRLNYQSNLNTFNSQGRSKRSNYKQVKTTDDNFFFGSANQEYESRQRRELASRNRKIAQRQSFCDYMTIFLVFSALISIFVAIILLFLIALDAWSMQTTFTIILIILCILTVLLVLLASFTANFYFYYNANSNTIDWMLHYGRKNYNAESSSYYFGKKSLNKDEENNDTESSLIEQI